MPRGFTQENFDVLNERLRILSLPTERFLNTNVIAIGGVVNYLASVRAFRPKALQLHYFKNACPQIPNSLFELFFDVSPASVSIINTSRDPYVDANSDNLDIAELPTTTAEFKIAINMAYCLGKTGISAINNNLPQLRQPRSSDISEADFTALRDNIIAGFAMGYLERTISSGEALEDDETYSIEVVEETPVEEVVEEVVEETPVETSDDRPNILTMPIVEGSSLSALDVGISAEDLNRAVENTGSAIRDKVFGILDSAQRLLQLGYEPMGVRYFLQNINTRGFFTTRVRMERGAYYVLSIEATNRGVRRFNSSTYIPILNTLIGNTSTADLPSNLRPVRFTGGGNSGSILFGQLAIPPVMGVSDFDTVVVPSFVQKRAIIERYEREYLASGGAIRVGVSTEPVSTETTTEAQATESVTLGTRPSGYSLIGYQFARSQMLYGNEVKLIPMPKPIGEYDMSEGQNNAFVFYFLGYDGQSYTLKQLQWGSLTDYPSSDIFFSNERDRRKFKKYLATNPRLSTPNTLKLTNVDFPVDNFLRDLKDRRFYRPRFSSRVTATIDLSQSTFNIGNVESLIDNEIDLIRETIGSQESTTRSQASTTLTKSQMVAVSKKPFDEYTFGWELEMYVKQGSRSGAMSEINSNNPSGALRFSDPADTLPVNEGQYALVRDGSISSPSNSIGRKNRSDEGFVGYDEAELVSPVLKGKKGLSLVKKACESLMKSGVRINSTDGLHIHFDAHGRSPSKHKLKAYEIANLMINYNIISPVIDKYQAVYRTKPVDRSGNLTRGNRWALDFDDATINKLKDFAQQKKTDYLELYKDIYGGDRNVSGWRVGASRQKYHGSRYRTVNIHSAVSTTGTIEFRQGSPTTDYLYIENWILWMYYLTLVSKDGFFKKPSDTYGSPKYNSEVWTYCELFLPDDVASYIANATYMIDGETVEQNFNSPRTRARIR